MTPSQQCKAAGLKGLAELSRLSNTSEQTLRNWHRDNPVRFQAVLAGAVSIKYLAPCLENKQ